MIQLTKSWSRHKRELVPASIKSLVTGPAAMCTRLIKKWKLARQASRQRHTLECLNEHQLRDIGYTREQVNAQPGHGIFDISAFRCNDIGIQQGGLSDLRRTQVTRLPKD